MATVNKDFKIKNGLVVEGSNATVNGNQILTENASDQYIIDLIGGETLVTSVDADQLQVVGGELSVKAEVFDAFGDAEYALTTANSYTDGEITTALSTASGYADAVAGDLSDHEALSAGVHGVTGSVVGTTDTQDLSNKRIIDTLHFSDGITIANEGEIQVQAGSHVFNIQANDGDLNLKTVATGASVYVISQDADIVLAADGNSYVGSVAAGNEIATRGYANDAAGDALADANAYTDGEITTALTTAQGYADAAETAANEYTDLLLGDATIDGSGGNTVTDRIATAIADLVDSAPATLDTLNELAAALGDAVDAEGLATAIGNKLPKAGGTMSGEIAMGTNKITGLGTPTANTDAATKAYVDDQTTSDVAEGTNLYFTDARALTATAFAYDTAGAAADAETNANSYTDTEIDALTTSDIEEGTNLYFTNQRAIDAVGGTIGDQIDLLTTDDIEEGATNLYFSDTRAKASAADLLTGATKTNITITGTGAGLTITAENGVADSDTDDLVEGTTNLYFNTERAQDAVDGTTRSFTAININTFRTEEATQQLVPSASTVTAHTFSGNKSVKYLVRTVGNVAGTLHSQITELLATVDGGNNIAVTEYGTIHTSEDPLATATVDFFDGEYRLRVTTAISGAEVVAAATLMSWAD